MSAARLGWRSVAGLTMLALTGAPSCSDDGVEARALALNDPLDLIDDVSSAGQTLRILAFRAGVRCDPERGVVTPDPIEAPLGRTPDAVVDVSVAIVDGMARTELRVPEGTGAVLVRGRGNDAATGRRDVLIATGCASIDGLRGGETRQIAITLRRAVVEGVCGDGVLSPDEQCEDAFGDSDCVACRTVPFPLAADPTGQQRAVRFASSFERTVATYDSGGREVRMMLLDGLGGVLGAPALLALDAGLDDALFVSTRRRLDGVQLDAWPTAHEGHYALAVTNYFDSDDPEVDVVFFDRARIFEADAARASDDRPRPQERPSAAFASDGTLLVVFDDAASGTGYGARFFDAGATSPRGAVVELGEGHADGNAVRPRIVRAGDGFLVVFENQNGIALQRIATDGSLIDATARPLAGIGALSEPSVATYEDRVVLAARDSLIDGDGTGIAAFVFSVGDLDQALPTPISVAAEERGDQSAPSVALSPDGFAIAFVSGAEVRARFFEVDGRPTLYRDTAPTDGEQVIAASARAPTLTFATDDGPNDRPRRYWLFGYESTADDSEGDVLARRIPVGI